MATAVGYKLTIKPTFRALNGRFTKANKKLLKERREDLKKEGRRYVKLAQAEAPRRTGEFASNIRFRTTTEGGNLIMSVSTPDPLGKWIISGTKAHPIPRSPKPVGTALRFVIGGQVFFRRQVQHPGTKANPFMGRATRRWFPGARKMLNRISTRYVSEITR